MKYYWQVEVKDSAVWRPCQDLYKIKVCRQSGANNTQVMKWSITHKRLYPQWTY